MSRRLLLPVAFFFTTSGLMVVVTGGFVTTMLGLRVSSRSPVPAFSLALITLVAWWLAARRRGEAAGDLAAAERWIALRSGRFVAAIAVLAALVATFFHTFSATGSDASGYLSYTALLIDGRLLRPEPLASMATWADGAATLAPLGWRAAIEPGLQVPTYAIGLPLLMAPLHAFGGADAASLIVPLTFGAAVWVTGMLAHRIAGGAAAIVAAVWLATSPVALIEAMQVMSDVPVTAAWLACWWLAFSSRPGTAGVVAALAVLIRPNLAPLAILPALYILVTGTARAEAPDFRQGVWFSIPVALAGVLVGYLQWRYFGSPFRSGYGTAEEIYALANVSPNAALYARWLLDTHGPWLLAAPLVLLIPLTGRPGQRREIRWLVAFAGLVVTAYFIYAVFETWTYLRFLLPALAIAMIAVAAIVATGLARVPAALGAPGLALVVLALATLNIAAARDLGVFRFADHQVRARTVGERLADVLPPYAIIVSGEQSGSMRYYTGRSIVRWDAISQPALAEALDVLDRNGQEVWVVLDDWEEEAFRRKFPGLAAASIDSRPAVESASSVGVRTRAWNKR